MAEPNLKEAAEIIARKHNRAVKESAEKIIRGRACQSCRASSCYSSCPTLMISSGDRAVFSYLAGTKPPNNNEKEPLPAGVPVFGGGSKSKRRKSPKKNPPVLSVWSGI